MTEMRASLVIDADGSSIVGESKKITGGLDSVSTAADKTAASFQKVTTQSQAAERMQQRLNNTFNNFGVGARSARDSAAAFDAAYKARDAYRALEESIDPLIRAERELAAAQQVVNTAMNSGVATKAQANQSLQTLQARYDQVVAAQTRVGQSSKAMSGGVQNASFQIADVAVQLQAGTAASIVFAQQMPQLLGGFGMIGAVMGAVVAVGAPLVSMLLDSDDAAGTLDENLGKLDTSLQSVTDRLELLRDQDLGLTFGSMAADIRDMTQALLELDRASELKTLRTTLDSLLREEIEPSLWQKFSQGFALGAAPLPGVTTEDYLTGDNISRENYGALTGGRGPSFEEFQSRREGLNDLAKAGNVDEVTSEVLSLISDFAGGGPITEMNDELLQMLVTLGSVVQKTAEVEAQFNGSAMSAALDKEATSLVTSYQRQSELSGAILQHGENSAEVEAVRNQHARDALKLRLQELGVEDGSARQKQVLAAFDQAQAAQAAAQADERNRSIHETLTGLSDELAVSRAIITSGEHSTAVEQLRTEQAREALRIRLEEIGATEEQIRQAEELLEQSRAAAREAEQARAEKEASQSLDSLRRQADVNRAILQYGKDSLEVKRLQIEAARAEYVQSLATKKISEETKQQLLEQWDATNGLKSVDPFGSLASARSILETQNKSVARIELEQRLIGQSETTKRRVLALYEAELQIRQAGIDAESEMATRIRDGAEAASDRAAELERQKDAWEDIQRVAEDSIDGMVDAALGADLPGVFESISNDIETILTDLAIKNPLKNILLGTDLSTIGDVGGLGGIWDRLTGKTPAIDPAAAAKQAADQSIASMQVTATSVNIGGAGISQFMSTMGGAGAAAANLPNSPVASQIWKFFEGKGMQPHQIAGIVGNVSAESSFNPAAVGDAGTSFGLFQHHGSRGDALLSSVGGMAGLGNVDAQLEHVWQELLTSENGVLKNLLATTNVQDATDVWMRGFERPSEDAMQASWGNRLGTAESALSRFGSTAMDATSDLGTLGSGFDVFGSALSSALQGVTSGGGAQAGLSGFLGTIGKAVAGGLGLPGFATGGHTGSGDPSKVAGLVHQDEYVFTAAQTARIGVANLQAIAAGRMPGYARGGYVSNAGQYGFLSEGPSTGGVIDTRPVITVNNNSSVPIVDDQIEETTDAKGQRQYTLSLSDAVATGLSAPGGKAGKTLRTQYGVKPGTRRRS